MRFHFVQLLFFTHFALDLFAKDPVAKQEAEYEEGHQEKQKERFPQTFNYQEREDIRELLQIENSYLQAASTGDWKKVQTPSSAGEETIHNLLAVILNSPKNLVPFQYPHDQIIDKLLLSLAVEGNQTESLQILLSWMDSKQLLSFLHLESAFIIASRKYGNSGVIKLLSEREAFKGKKNQAAISDLFLLACKDGDEKLVETLNSFVTNGNRNMGFAVAAQFGHDHIVKLLLADGRVNAVIRDEMPLHIAIHEGHAEVAKLLMPFTKLDKSKLGKIALSAGQNTSFFRELDLPYPVDKDNPEGIQVELVSVDGHLPKAASLLPDTLEVLNEFGFERIFMTLGQKDKSLVHSLIIKRVTDNSSNKPETLYEALQEIASHLKEVPGVLVNLLPFMVACKEGYGDIVDAYLEDGRIIKDYTYLPFFKDTYLDLAFSIDNSSRYEPPSLSVALIKAAAKGYATIANNLIRAGADPATSLNAPFNIACEKKRMEVIKLLLRKSPVKNHPQTASRMFLYLLETQDFRYIRSLFLGEKPELTLKSLRFLNQAYKDKLFEPLATLLGDPELVSLFQNIRGSKEIVLNIVSLALAAGESGIIKAVLGNLDAFEEFFGSDEVSKLTLGKSWLFEHASANQMDMVRVLLKHPKRSKREAYKLVLRLILRYPDPSYVMDVLTEKDLSHKILKKHLQYYLPTDILRRMFPSPWYWKHNDFLRAVEESAESGEVSEAERLYQNLLFDKSMGLFGIPVGQIQEGGFTYYDKHFINMIDDLENHSRLTSSPELETLKMHLRQVASAIMPVRDEFGGYRDKRLIQESIRKLRVSETYLLTLSSRSRNTDGHTLYALVEKIDDLNVNVKVFNSYHYALKQEDSENARKSPYIEWNNLPVEEFISKSTEIFETHNVLLSKDIQPIIPSGLSNHLRTKGQRTGTCSCFKFWLISKYDLKTLPQFLEFSVALHLYLIEGLHYHFKTMMHDWKAKVPRVWLAITKTPHFEGQLLKDIEDIKDEDPQMYRKLRGQIITSVQKRYRLYSEQSVLDLVQWKERFLETIPEKELVGTANPASSSRGQFDSSSEDDSSSDSDYESSSSDED